MTRSSGRLVHVPLSHTTQLSLRRHLASKYTHMIHLTYKTSYNMAMSKQICVKMPNTQYSTILAVLSNNDLCPALDGWDYDTCCQLIFTETWHGEPVILGHHGHGHGAHARLWWVTHVTAQDIRHTQAKVAAAAGPSEAQDRVTDCKLEDTN